MVSSIINTIYDNLQSLIIGRFYSAKDLGYVNQAKKLESIPSGALTSIVSQVSLPVFSHVQEDKTKLQYGLSRNIRALEYVNFPMMVLMIVVAKPLILLLYGEKWEMSVLFFQILCVSRFISVVNSLNYSVIQALRNGKMYLTIQLLKCIIAVVFVFFSVHHGVYVLMVALALIPYCEFLMCSAITKKQIGYGLLGQIRDVLPFCLVSIITGCIVYLFGIIIHIHPFFVMALQIVLYLVLYILITKFLKIQEFDLYYQVILRKVLKK